MELALQVVGLKMTGKIEDAKNVAMRIVGGGGGGGPDNQNSYGHDTPNMQLSDHPPAPFSRDFRPLLFGRAGETENFEKAVIDFLSILDTPLDSFSFPHSITTSEAISQTTPTGQSLLHLATYMRLPALVEWLIRHEADIDARDKNGYTALHFAALVACTECARIMVSGGADREIVNYLGKTAEEIAPKGFFDAVLPIPIGGGDFFCDDDGDDGDVESEIDIVKEEEGEAGWGDVEDEEEEHGEREVSRDGITKTRKWLKRHTPRRIARKKKNAKKVVANRGRGTPRRSLDISPRAATPSSFSSSPSKLFTEIKSKNDLPSSTTVPLERPNSDGMRAAAAASPSDVDDAKQTASFIDLIHRTLTQLSDLPKKTPLALPFPNLLLPDLKKGNIGMPGWNALPQLPQIPMAFSVFVIPTPAWPWFLAGFGSDANDSSNDNDDHGKGSEDRKEKVADIQTQGVEEEKMMGDVGETNKPNAREWRAMWERWFALVMAKQQEQQLDRDIPPPEYTPRAAGHAESAAHGTWEEGADTYTLHEGNKMDTDAVHVSIPTGEGEQQGAVQSWSSLEVSSLQDNDNVTTTTTTRGSCLQRTQQHTHSHSHSIGYNNDIHIPLPREELDAYTYQPPVKQKQKRRKGESRFSDHEVGLMKSLKDDRMLLRFWLPVLLRESLSFNCVYWVFLSAFFFLFLL